MKAKNKSLRKNCLDRKEYIPIYVRADSNTFSLSELADLRYIEPMSELAMIDGHTTTTYVETKFENDEDQLLYTPYTTIWGKLNSIKKSTRNLSISEIAKQSID